MLAILTERILLLIAILLFISGVGNELHQYYLNSSKQTVHRHFCLNFRSKIYGISAADDQNESNKQFVVAYGGRELTVFLMSEDNQLKSIKHLTLNDWISSIKLYKPNSDNVISFCVVTAHSVASEFRVNINGEWSIQHKSSCADKCTLYCSFVIGDSWEDTTIFGGTAFGELIIWDANGDSPRGVHYRATGHNVTYLIASIFVVIISMIVIIS